MNRYGFPRQKSWFQEIESDVAQSIFVGKIFEEEDYEYVRNFLDVLDDFLKDINFRVYDVPRYLNPLISKTGIHFSFSNDNSHLYMNYFKNFSKPIKYSLKFDGGFNKETIKVVKSILEDSQIRNIVKENPRVLAVIGRSTRFSDLKYEKAYFELVKLMTPEQREYLLNNFDGGFKRIINLAIENEYIDVLKDAFSKVPVEDFEKLKDLGSFLVEHNESYLQFLDKSFEKQEEYFNASKWKIISKKLALDLARKKVLKDVYVRESCENVLHIFNALLEKLNPSQSESMYSEILSDLNLTFNGRSQLCYVDVFDGGPSILDGYQNITSQKSALMYSSIFQIFELASKLENTKYSRILVESPNAPATFIQKFELKLKNSQRTSPSYLIIQSDKKTLQYFDKHTFKISFFEPSEKDKLISYFDECGLPVEEQIDAYAPEQLDDFLSFGVFGKNVMYGLETLGYSSVKFGKFGFIKKGDFLEMYELNA